MNSTELIAKVRLNCLIEDGAVDYTDAVILSELNDALTTKFQQVVFEADSGYWVQNEVTTSTSGTQQVRMPARSIGLSKVQIGTGSSPTYVRLPQISEGHAELYEVSATQLGQPNHWVARGDQIVLMPPCDNGGYSFNVLYFIRPSKLVPQQSSTVGGTVRGQITAVNMVTRVLTVNVIPFDQSLAVPVAMTSGSQRIDVVHPDGWHELALVGATQTYSGLNITVGGTASLADIQVGDFVRVADQTDWPPLPDDFHRCLADVASVKILIQQSNQEKGVGFASDVSSDLQRFSKLIAQRVTEEPRVARADLWSLRRGFR